MATNRIIAKKRIYKDWNPCGNPECKDKAERKYCCKQCEAVGIALIRKAKKEEQCQ